jgi:inosine/xanthosine triphosphatase
MSQPPKLVNIGSTNPVKIQAVTRAFRRVWPEKTWQFVGVQVASGIAAQPMSDGESLKGARQRAHLALVQNQASFGVGLEGGVQAIGSDWFDCGWVVVVDQYGTEGLGSTARIITPPKMVQLLKQGMELGDVVDHFFGTKNAKQATGHFGLMTNGAITRTQGYTDGVIMALARFLHPDLF